MTVKIFIDILDIIINNFFKVATPVLLFCIWDAIKVQNKWLTDDEEIDNIGK